MNQKAKKLVMECLKCEIIHNKYGYFSGTVVHYAHKGEQYYLNVTFFRFPVEQDFKANTFALSTPFPEETFDSTNYYYSRFFYSRMNNTFIKRCNIKKNHNFKMSMS